MSRTRVDIETVRRIMEERAAINRLPLREIEWYENGERIEIDQEAIEEWEFTGLDNIYFITSGAYLGEVATALCGNKDSDCDGEGS